MGKKEIDELIKTLDDESYSSREIEDMLKSLDSHTGGGSPRIMCSSKPPERRTLVEFFTRATPPKCAPNEDEDSANNNGLKKDKTK